MPTSVFKLLLIVICSFGPSAAAQLYNQMDEISNMKSIREFPIEGVSIATPFIEMEEILRNNGWDVLQKTENVSMLLAKGDYIARGNSNPVFSKNGSTAYTLQINFVIYKDTKGVVLHFDRLPEEGELDERRRRIPKTGVISEDYLDLSYGMALKEMLCGGIVDEQKKWQSCPPNTKESVAIKRNKFHQGQERVSIQIDINADRGVVHLNYFEK